MWKLVFNLMLQPFYPGDSARYQMKRWLDVNITNLEALEKKNFLLQPGIDSRSFGCLARRLVTADSHYSIPSPVFLWKYSKQEMSYSGVDYVMQLDECWCFPCRISDMLLILVTVPSSNKILSILGLLCGSK